MAMGRYCSREVLPVAAMLTVECTSVGLNTLYKAAVSKGLSYHVFMVYSFAISALTLLPLACFLHRMEKLKLQSLSSQAKIIGALVSIAGALLVVLYNGPVLITGHDEKLRLPNISIIIHSMSGARSDWILGGALLAGCYVVSSIWYIFQGAIVKEYPAESIVAFFYSLFAFILSVPVGIVSEPYFSSWKVPADIRLLSILYSGIIGTGFAVIIHTWGLHVKGPVFVALFKPLSIGIAAILGVIFLGDDLYLGSVIGSIVITMGFYTVMWGKMKEEISETSDDNNVESSTDVIVPLLKH